MLPQKFTRQLTAIAVLSASALFLASCASTQAPSDDTSAASSGQTRTITDVGGEVEIPVDPQRIVALDEVAALNLLSIGITPTVVFDSWQTTVPAEVLESVGIEIADTASFFPELEEVAATEPDLIVGSINEAYLSRYPDYASIAPTVRAVMQATSDGKDVATSYGEYFDRADEAAAIVAALDETAAEVAALHADSPLELSALMAYAPETMVLHLDGDSTLAPYIVKAGFTQPELQTVSPEGGSMYGGWTPFSPETLAAQDADVVAVAVAAQYPVEGITGLPLYSSLAAVQADRSFVVDGDMWAGGASFYLYWVLEDLRTLASGETASAASAGTAADAETRWDAFVALTGN